MRTDKKWKETSTFSAATAPSESFGQWVQRRRRGLGLTQEALAHQLGCAAITLRKIESEERRPSLTTAKRLAECLQIPPQKQASFARFARGELRAGADLGDVFMQPTRVAQPASYLPQPPYPIIGREELLARAKEAMLSHHNRLLSLIGPPGVGKTRLALELAHSLDPLFAHGAAFVELAPVLQATLVPTAIAEALGIVDSHAADIVTALHAALRDKQQLLVLDNFEHVLEAAPFVAELIAACAGVCCLITSRERLRVRAEHLLDVPVLGLPQAATLKAVESAPAAQLFMARARQANPHLNLRKQDAPPVAALCKQLDGLPLALELLAARADVFNLTELHEDLKRGLDALEEGPRDLPSRHRTLRNAIQWSVRLLTSTQRSMFMDLAVFAGGFDEAALQGVYGNKDVERVKDCLQSLVRASLVQAVGQTYWRMLEPIRQFAEEMLVQQGMLAQLKARHAAHFVALAQNAREALLGLDAAAWMSRLEADHANMQAAIQWALQTQQPEIVLRIGQGIFRFWFRRGLWRDGLAWLEQALAMDEAASTTPLDIRAKALRAAGTMAQMLCQYERTDQHFLAALALAYRLEDDEQVAATYCSLGILRKEQGQFDEALSYFDQSISFQSERGLKFPWQSMADTLLRMGRFDEAEKFYRQAMALNKVIGDEEGLAHTLRGLGESAWRQGDADTAERLLQDNAAICRRLNHARALSWTAQQLGNVARTRGHWQQAADYYANAMAEMERLGDQSGLCEVFAEYAQLAVLQQDYAEAVRWLDKAQVGWRAIGAKLTPYEQRQIDGILEQCKLHLTPST